MYIVEKRWEDAPERVVIHFLLNRRVDHLRIVTKPKLVLGPNKCNDYIKRCVIDMCSRVLIALLDNVQIDSVVYTKNAPPKENRNPNNTYWSFEINDRLEKMVRNCQADYLDMLD